MTKKAKITKKLKVTEMSQEDPLGGTTLPKEEAPVKEFGFLAGAMGVAKEEGEEEEKGDQSVTVVAPSGQGATRPSATGGGVGEQVDDLDEVSAILDGLNTSDDAINFFARYGSETAVKFVHFKQVDDPREFRPYDLERIKGDLPTTEPYYTMSPAGIVQMIPGESSECVSLSVWMRQGMLFRILRNIGFYKHFLHRKAFTIWKENVRYQLFAKQRKGSRCETIHGSWDNIARHTAYKEAFDERPERPPTVPGRSHDGEG